jgi:hypothetical protein
MSQGREIPATQVLNGNYVLPLTEFELPAFGVLSYFRKGMSYGFNDSFSSAGSAPVVQIQKVGGWKLLAGATLAGLGLGFAGFVYLGPYQKVSKALGAHASELDQARGTADEMASERDKLKAVVEKNMDAERQKTATEGKQRESLQALAAELKTSLASVAANISVDDARVRVSFAVAALFEQPFSIGISPAGENALKVVVAALKKSNMRGKVKAKLIQTPPPRELGQFKVIGEFETLRAARVMLVLSSGGVAADHLAVAGEVPLPAARKGRGGVPDRLDIEIEPE